MTRNKVQSCPQDRSNSILLGADQLISILTQLNVVSFEGLALQRSLDRKNVYQLITVARRTLPSYEQVERAKVAL